MARDLTGRGLAPENNDVLIFYPYAAYAASSSRQRRDLVIPNVGERVFIMSKTSLTAH